MKFSFKSDTSALRGNLKQQKRQLPFAISTALNSSAFDIQRHLKSELPKKLDRPTPYTIRGVQVEKATKRTLKAAVGFAGEGFGRLPANAGIPPAEYMSRLIPKGPKVRTARPGTKGIQVPANARLNRYGNLPRNYISKVLGRGGFLGTINGQYGLWSSYQGVLQLVVAFERQTHYGAAPFDLFRLSVNRLKQVWNQNLSQAIARANRTARRRG